MATVELEDGEWQVVITALAMSNPIVVKIATQLQKQQAPPNPDDLMIRDKVVAPRLNSDQPS